MEKAYWNASRGASTAEIAETAEKSGALAEANSLVQWFGQFFGMSIAYYLPFVNHEMHEPSDCEREECCNAETRRRREGRDRRGGNVGRRTLYEAPGYGPPDADRRLRGEPSHDSGEGNGFSHVVEAANPAECPLDSEAEARVGD